MASVEVMKERARIGHLLRSLHRRREGSVRLSPLLPAKMRLTRSPAYARLRAVSRSLS